MSEIIDTYNESNGSLYYSLGYGMAFLILGQSFHNTEQTLLNSCKFYLNKSGSPTGSAYAQLYAHSGTFGTSSTATGSALDTSDAFDVSTISGAGLVEFTFDGDYEMSPDTDYVIACNYSDGDVDNNVLFGLDNTSPTHEGNLVTNAGTWSYDNTLDGLFYVYGTINNPKIQGISLIQGLSSLTL